MHEPAEHLKQPNQVNRGFLFIEFPSHMEACEFRKQMAVNRTLMPFGKIMPNIDWAEPVIVPDEAEVAKVSPHQSYADTDKSLDMISFPGSIQSRLGHGFGNVCPPNSDPQHDQNPLR